MLTAKVGLASVETTKPKPRKPWDDEIEHEIQAKGRLLEAESEFIETKIRCRRNSFNDVMLVERDIRYRINRHLGNPKTLTEPQLVELAELTNILLNIQRSINE